MKKDPIQIGFIGAPLGMSLHQKEVLTALLKGFSETHNVTFHHGDELLADQEAHTIASDAGCDILAHPAIGSTRRAYTMRRPLAHAWQRGMEAAPAPENERDNDIVCTDIFIVCPGESEMEKKNKRVKKSVRFAKKFYQRMLLIEP